MGSSAGSSDSSQSSAISIFLNKLKEQSFTVVLMVAIVYYQHAAWQADKAEYLKEIHSKDDRIMALIDREHDRLIEREKHLIQQRDEFISILKEQAAWNQAESRLTKSRSK
jgi:hypothetical protein